MTGRPYSPEFSPLRAPVVAGRQGAHAFQLLVIPAAAVLALGCVVLLMTGVGPLSTPMALHIAAMSVAAPLSVLGAHAIAGARETAQSRDGAGIWMATLVQLVVLWAWHMPAAQAWAISSHAVAAVMHLSLLLAALWFWLTLATAARHWQSIFALLVTGKLVCLLGALLIFAPRVLCAPAAGASQADGLAALTLADQQLAGLLMISGCSLSYVLAAVVLAAQTMDALARTARAGLVTSR